MQEIGAMRRRCKILFSFLFLFLFAFSSFYLSRDAASGHGGGDDRLKFFAATATSTRNSAIQENDPLQSHRTAASMDGDAKKTVAVLLPAWEVLVIASPDITADDRYFCLFQNNNTSPARFAGVLPPTNQTMFKCVLPNRVRRRQPFFQPVLTRTPEKEAFDEGAAEGILRWKFLAYDSLSTDDDVLVFVKGVNQKSGFNRPAGDFNCVFGEADAAVRTAVTSSAQEVFRCAHPNLTAQNSGERVKVSLEIKDQNIVVPSVAHYTTPRRIENEEAKSLLCASTMVYNVAKFLKEWVMYHSSIGVQRFILYDNDSDDDLHQIIADLNGRGYHVELVHWIWPKTQEAGFSHSAIYAKKMCEWMLYVDVDEFVYSPTWANSSAPSPGMLQSLLPNGSIKFDRVGQVSIMCNEFGPSGRVAHPEKGVTQGYDCRRKMEQRHKSILRLEAAEASLMNVIHHFQLRGRFETRMLGMETAVVNHYKYQAWSEFRNKFRRRVSAYVVDWTEKMNMESKDRTPGLGLAPVEPEGWSHKFCEVRDERLKLLCQRWFGNATTPFGYRMAWQ